MNEHDGLEPTVAMPRIEASPGGLAPAYLPPQPIPPQPFSRQVPFIPPPDAARVTYVFGNPFGYALRRFLAFALDLILVTSVATMLLYGLIAINPFTGLPNNSEGGFDATLGMGLAIALLYLWLFEAILGTTLGKLAFSLHVYAPKHRIVGFGRAFVRNLLRPVDFLVIGWILALLPGHRRLGDLFGGTVVAHSPLRAFSPLVGWLLLIGLGALPFLVAGGTVTVLAVGTAFVEFVPPLIVRAVHEAFALVGALGALPAAIHTPVPSAPPPAPVTTG
ncbi:MAG: RDD family protein [Candidatus Velthaea sp.]|jgi:uncharacterized RDD family membrane protein YckC